MQRWKELPGFRTYRDFFAVLPRDYENIVPEDRLKRSLIDAIPKIELIDDDSYWFDRIRREPSEMVDHCMSDILDDWHESAVVREVRQFPMRQGREGVFAFGSETYYVRFEVASLYPRGVWGSPIALMMVADAFYRPMSYTFIYGNGRLQNGVSCRSCYGVGDSVAAAQRDFALLECGDVLEVSNADKFSERIAGLLVRTTDMTCAGARMTIPGILHWMVRAKKWPRRFSCRSVLTDCVPYRTCCRGAS